MKKTALFISLLFICTAFSAASLQAQGFEFEMDQTLVIGEEDSDSTQYLFSAIRWVRPDNQGNILVAGTANNSIRVFDENGQYKHAIGRRGRGPGEFHELTSVEITGDNEIIVLDRLQHRASIFTTEGELLRTEKLNNLGPTSTDYLFFDNNNNEFYVIARNYNAEGKRINLVHRFDSSLRKQNGEYINVFQFFFNHSDPLHVRLTKSSYTATIFGASQIAVAPNSYTGAVAVLNLNTFEEERWGIPISNFVTEYDQDEQDRYLESDETGFAFASGQDDGFFYKKKGYNFGLVGNENFLLHFYGLFKGDDIIPYLNVYNAEGELLTEVELREHDVPAFISERTTMSVIPHFLDEDNNLYIGDYSYEGSYPVARVFETNLDELLE